MVRPRGRRAFSMRRLAALARQARCTVEHEEHTRCSLASPTTCTTHMNASSSEAARSAWRRLCVEPQQASEANGLESTALRERRRKHLVAEKLLGGDGQHPQRQGSDALCTAFLADLLLNFCLGPLGLFTACTSDSPVASSEDVSTRLPPFGRS